MAVEPSRWGIIYNPKAGSRKTQKRWNEIRDYMESRKVVFDYVQSEGFGSVERLARTLANNGYRTIVVVGGDDALTLSMVFCVLQPKTRRILLWGLFPMA